MSAVVCAIAKCEDLYIDEWIRYNLKLGFDHVYVYDNSDEHALRDLPTGYGGRVTVFHFPGKVRQLAAYNDFLVRFKTTHAWAAFIDVDEFIVLKKHRTVRELLAEHCKEGGLALNWFLFGSSGLLAYSPEPVVSRFRRRSATIDRHVKTIAHLPSTTYVGVHDIRTCKGAPHDTNGRAFTGPFNPGGPTDVAVIHHYTVKSKEECDLKINRGARTST